MVDERLVSYVDLSALEDGRHRNDDRELLRIALEVIRHRQNGSVLVAHEHDL